MRQPISAEILQRLPAIRGAFQNARPFRHVCLENFLDPDLAERLLAEFPTFDTHHARDEFGGVGGKAVNTDMRNIGPAYRELYDYLTSPGCLDSLSEMLGIPGLRFDRKMYGGGTHENLEGQELDPHVDFNYEPVSRLHRRVNLLIYLNKEWELSWGGGIELHSNPRDWARDEVKTFNCTFNRCVIFETNEISWHGFSRIQLPADKKHLSRKCISIYLYTRKRPKEEIAPPHGTFYVQRPLPAKFAAGYALTANDVNELKNLLVARDGWVKYYQEMELRIGREHAYVGAYLLSLPAKAWRRLYASWKRMLS